jgi:4-oxalocrotonate tautomerase
MPFVNVKVFEDRLEDAEFAGKLTSAVTEAIVSVCGEDARENTWVVVDGVPRSQWSFGGERKL